MADSNQPTPDQPTSNQMSASAKPGKQIQAMDIIPRSRIRPSTTSRPVILDSAPAVADNTMKVPSTAPSLRLKRHSFTLEPIVDGDHSSDSHNSNNITNDKPASPMDVPSAPPLEQGVAVKDLLAKQAERSTAASPEANEASENSATHEAGSAYGESTYDSGSEAAEGVEALQGDADKPPAGPEDKDEAAANEAARLLNDSRPSPATVNDEFEPRKLDVGPAASDPTSLAAAAKQPLGAIEDQPQPVPGSGPDRAAVAASEHSPSLKAAMQDLEKDQGQADPAQAGLYEGKPVIVVHKDRKPMSAVAWVLWFFLCLLLALVAVNFLLDAGVIETAYRIPHTDIL